MAETDGEDPRATEASLELPSFGRRRRRRQAVPDPGGTPTDTPTGPRADGTPTTAPGPAEAHPEPAPEPEPASAHPAATVTTRPSAPMSPIAPTGPTLTTGPSGPSGPTDAVEATEAGARTGHARSRGRRLPGLPALSGAAAALVTGLVVGLVGVLLTLGSMSGCEALRGTASCGGPGAFLLLAILAVMILLGRTLLAAWQVRDATSTSVLAVGLAAVVCLTVLIDALLEPTMVVVVPLVAMACFGVSQWVTARAAESEDRGAGD